jgi:lipopolysaccharide/colanic/teichoic acid biosynthesis glycosyltransferase
MHTNFDREGRGIQIKASSQAITSVGRILRRTKLDELPQLFNILRGDMSFVGPRPELPRRLRYYSPKDMHVFDVLSGITSPASIVFSDEEFLMEKVDNPEVFYVQRIMPLKISLNLYYIDKKSFIYDLKIVLTTLLKLFFRLKLTGVVSDQNLLICKSQLREEVLESSR